MIPRVVVGIDPGGKTGMAYLRDGTVHLEEVGDKHRVCEIVDDLLASTPSVQIVIEGFIPRPGVKFVPDSLHIIGTCSYLAWKWNQSEPVVQTPAEAKNGFPDRRLKDWGGDWWSKSEHARDSARHLAVWLTKKKLLNPRTGEILQEPMTRF